jgi:hypothetical protein
MYVRKTISNLLSMLEVLIWENINSNTILCLFKPMQAILQRDIYKTIYTKEGMYYQQSVWNWISKYYFIKYHPWFYRII